MEDPILYWTKVAAVGQIVGAAATFFAVLVALWLAASERRVALRVSAKFWTLYYHDRDPIPVIAITVDNVGHRPAKVTMFGWTTGYVNSVKFLPNAFRLKSGMQNPDYTWDINPKFPWMIEPGESKSTYMRRDSFLNELKKPNEHDLFRKLPWQSRKTLFRLRVCVTVETHQKPIYGKVDRAVVDAIEKAYQG